MEQRVVIIGTGAGGLMAAASLARAGYEVVALERGKQLGGFLNPFARKRFHFDPGVHYVGQCRRGEMMHRVLRSVGIDAEQIFCEMNRDGFDVLRFPGFEIRVCAGLEDYLARLKDAFPSSRAELDRFFDLLRLVAGLMNGRRPDRLSSLRALPSLLRLRGTFKQLLDAKISDPHLRSVLAGQCGDMGLPPSRAPAFLGLAIMLHFAEGSFFPRGGSGGLRDALVDAGRAHGATYRRRAEVTRIHVERGKVAAVELASGERIDADVVVSAIDPTLTYGQLIDERHVPAKLLKKVRRTEASVASLCVFLGMERDLRDHGLGDFNVWDYPSWDIDGVYKDIIDGRMPERDWPFFLSPNSLKDDTGAMAPAGCSTLEIVTLAPHAPFAQWQGTKSFKRGAEYDEFKNRAADSLIAAVDERWPGLIGDIVVRDVATPLTNTHFVNTPGGSIYGPAATPSQFGLNSFRPWTPIDGLVLAGAGTLGPGVATCLASGAVAAKVVQRARRPSRAISLAGARRLLGVAI